jgi:hypothetical protein
MSRASAPSADTRNRRMGGGPTSPASRGDPGGRALLRSMPRHPSVINLVGRTGTAPGELGTTTRPGALRHRRPTTLRPPEGESQPTAAGAASASPRRRRRFRYATRPDRRGHAAGGGVVGPGHCGGLISDPRAPIELSPLRAICSNSGRVSPGIDVGASSIPRSRNRRNGEPHSTQKVPEPTARP